MTRPLIFASYEDNEGTQRHPPQAVLSALHDRLGQDELPEAVTTGQKAFVVDEQVTGLAVQLYALRHEGDWGIGDFAGLAKLCSWAADQGLALVGVNPLHALRTSVAVASPYYPVSRFAVHPLYISIPTLAEHLGTAVRLNSDGEAAREKARSAALIDYEAVSAAKFAALREIFKREGPAIDLSEEEGPLRDHALWEAHDHLTGSPPDASLLKDPSTFLDSEEARQEVRFHLFLQWAADLQLRHAIEAGEGRTRLYLDLAVGAAPDGSEVRRAPGSYVEGVRLGAPPDVMGPEGQDWGITPLHPVETARTDARTFRAILEASAQYAGALRIDHALGLQRQFFIPEGFEAKDATYVAFPRDLLFSAVADVSRDHQCAMIGEALGTVPEGLVDAMHSQSILSYEVTRWARDEDGDLLSADEYPQLCLAAATTHDIAPIAGWLDGSDLKARVEAGQLRPEKLDEEQTARAAERGELLKLWGLEEDPDADEAVRAAHGFLAASSAKVAMLTLEDLLLQKDMMNLPGTTDQHPNWRRRYSATFEEWTLDEAVLARLREGLR